ncbi:putative porin [Labilibaculum sp. K2S]|uniref:putative porin n=1 Tax=Labilibaculum sp. K2S TaxID=3056386 RepID=UPI0025A316FB|nr:putative porin [Labilibaculum sp. K2S]MDM8160728.1 putative porin [Labilibaculum sp. K2S]
MKQFFLLVTILICHCLNSYAQVYDGGFDDPQRDKLGNRGKLGKEGNELDSLGYNSVKSVIKSWKLTDFSSKREFVELDTILGSQHNYNPIFRNSISNTYLGNLGSPYLSNVYRDRNVNEQFLPFSPYRNYMLKPEDIVFFNTTTPFTSVYYETGGPKGRAENLLRVLQTQNINPNLNVGVSYNLISSDGQYQNQKTKLYDFSFFSSYKKERYGLDFVLNQNSMNNEENGGLSKDTDLTEKSEDPENLKVRLDDARSKLTNFNFFMNHSYGIGEEREVIQEKDTSYSYPINFIYNLAYESDSWRYKETLIDNTFYSNYYYDTKATFDKVEYSNIRNMFQLVFNENKNKWIRLGARFGIISDLGKYNSRLAVNEISFHQKDTKIHNNQLLASLFSSAGSSLNWNATGRYVFEGYKQNDFELKYELTKWIGKKDSIHHGVSVLAKLNSKTPDFLLSKYYGNHQQWNLNLDKITELELGIEYFNEKRNLKIGGQINQIDNYTYFGLDTIPEQTGKGITVLTGYLEKRFKLGNFYLSQKLVGQKGSEDKILPLPTFSIYSNNYYKNTFFKGALGLQVGFTVHYNTAFYAPDYMPSTGQFFLQDQKEIGDYPKVDVYFNFRIKRTRIFVMYEHMNASIGSKSYFVAPHYPLNPAMLKYGLIWTFYN